MPSDFPARGIEQTNKTNKENKEMHTAAKEWAARVAARNKVEAAKAAALSAQGYLPFTYGEQPAAPGEDKRKEAEA